MLSLEWQQLLTHTLGFLITLWVLKKFAWVPILNLLEERRQKIVDEFDNIEKEKEAADKLRLDYENKLKNIEAERPGLRYQNERPGRSTGYCYSHQRTVAT